MTALNTPSDPRFETTVLFSYDLSTLRAKLPKVIQDLVLDPYIRLGKSVVRAETDVVMFTHLLLYFSTSVPSALYLYLGHFSWLHAVVHLFMQFSYIGTYTLMMHQHIHMRGILNKRFWLFDTIFPYILDPLHGHTWNSYYHHHVKHHHVEGNGPDDLSSTIRYQRDDIFHFLHYVGRFYFLAWIELPLYFIRTKRYALAARAAFWEWSSYLTYYTLYRLSPRPTLMVFIIPFLVLRVALMVGNWGQHAFVDDTEPDSDYRTSITLIDVTVRSSTHPFLFSHSLVLNHFQNRATGSATTTATTHPTTSTRSVTGASTRSRSSRPRILMRPSRLWCSTTSTTLRSP